MVAPVTLLDHDEEFWGAIATRPSTFIRSWLPVAMQVRSSGRVLERVEGLARGCGVGHVRLDAAADNRRLRSWYEERGLPRRRLTHLRS